ncbi:MAG TPA: filamentous hemagglutinin N-terminal domain-containing protein, partial [Pseudoxanthomonas sp.]|nr:filamentous hemagglutinin N-terminal domain-containing protein [Pseudoxanthomonas sp.]
MNKHLYRIVFNRCLGLLQVASERASSAVGAAPAAGRGDVLATVRPLRFALWLLLGLVGWLPQAQGQVVADPVAPGDRHPTVLRTPSGVPVVNIRTPSARGVSRNAYRQFDVGPEGVILNNARAGAATVLGGPVQGNPWLAAGTARIILNEVNSADPSHLRGYVEVAGDRAEVVIANPAGISCDGCGFINASRATLATGTAIVEDGGLRGYRVQDGTIRVEGLGMDGRGTDYTALIARSVQVNAGLWAQRLEVTTGSNLVDAGTGRAEALAAREAGSATPAFALDVGALGGMYAGRIALVGTEHGVGVRNAGDIGAHAGDLVVTVDGRLENSGAMQSLHDTRLAAGEVANAGTISAEHALRVDAGAALDNSGGVLTARQLEADAGTLRNRGGSIVQTGAQDLALQAGALSNRDGGRIGVAPDAPAGQVPGPG